MATIVLPDVDRSTLDELRKHLPNLAEVEIPKMEDLGRQADETIDRLRGRSRAPSWPWWAWLATALGVMAIVGGIAYLMTWRRSSTWSASTTDPWTEDALSSMGSGGSSGLGTTGGHDPYGSNASGTYGSATSVDVTGVTTGVGSGEGMSGSGLGLSAAEASLMSTDPDEDRTA
jgi:hypothetical protein